MAHGYCNVHYQRLYHHGSPLAGGPRRNTKGGEPFEWLSDHVAHEGDDCLIWPFSFDNKGYGQVTHAKRPWKASRLMCTLAHGEPPSRQHEAAHSCGNRACVNPGHLRWATPVENQADKVAHGTTNRGRRSAMARLTEDQVRAIRALKGRHTQDEIGRMFGVSRNTVASIIRGDNWAWLE